MFSCGAARVADDDDFDAVHAHDFGLRHHRHQTAADDGSSEAPAEPLRHSQVA
jgi:hypothetical protein